jgi:hypothetical protein
MSKKNQWVIKHGDKWALKGEGNFKVTKITKTQKEAIAIGKEIVKNQKSELIIHNSEGKIRSKDRYGNDPRDV